jgi:hypothetical protein
VQLHPPRAVDEVQERGLALPAAGGEPAGHPRPRTGLLAVGECLVRRLDLGDRPHARIGVRERLDPLGAQRLQLAPALREELVAHVTPWRRRSW